MFTIKGKWLAGLTLSLPIAAFTLLGATPPTHPGRSFSTPVRPAPAARPNTVMIPPHILTPPTKPAPNPPGFAPVQPPPILFKNPAPVPPPHAQPGTQEPSGNPPR
ncbi:MAG: hypothetical protein WBE59_16100 [Candidatus Cybelea sp.]